MSWAPRGGGGGRGAGVSVRAAGVATVVCWRTQVEDSAARVFVEAFFEAVTAQGREHDYRRAYWNAVHAVSLKTHPTVGMPLGNDVPMYKLCAPSARPKRFPSTRES